jgi:hypothetical protein
MTNRQSARLHKLHRSIAPIVILPLLLTVITGVIYQITDLSGHEAQWLLGVHQGNFGALKLEAIYPFLNGLGLLAMLATGTVILLNARRHPRRTIGEE